MTAASLPIISPTYKPHLGKLLSPSQLTQPPICLNETNCPDFVVCYFTAAFALTLILVKYLDFPLEPIFSTL